MAMRDDEATTSRFVVEMTAARDFYANLGLEVGYFSALWHTFNVGHMLETDLDRICRRHDLSIADFNVLGALRIDRLRNLRATDLAVILQVSNSSLTSRIVKLGARRLLVKTPLANDRRSFTLQLTPEGATKVEVIHSVIERESAFVREVSRLPEADRAVLERIMGDLHGKLERYFVLTPR